MVSKDHGYKPFPARLIIAKVSEDDQFPIKFITSNFERYENDCSVTFSDGPGDYFIWSDVEFDEAIPLDTYAVAIYAPTEVGLEAGSYDGFLEKAIADCAHTNGRRAQYND